MLFIDFILISKSIFYVIQTCNFVCKKECYLIFYKRPFFSFWNRKKKSKSSLLPLFLFFGASFVLPSTQLFYSDLPFFLCCSLILSCPVFALPFHLGLSTDKVVRVLNFLTNIFRTTFGN